MKYELTDNTINHTDKTLYQIRALKEFRDVKTGDLGGYVESTDNLSQYDDCWVYDTARVFGTARVCGQSRVSD